VMVEVLFSDVVGGWMDGWVEVSNRQLLILTYVEGKRCIRTKVAIRVMSCKREGRNNGVRWDAIHPRSSISPVLYLIA
jgi:hypothetical protein